MNRMPYTLWVQKFYNIIKQPQGEENFLEAWIRNPGLNIPKDVTKAQRPSWIIVATHSIDCDCDVKGDATDASRSESEIPTEACFRAPVSFAPSPQKTVT